MYSPRYDIGHIAQRTMAARLTAAVGARNASFASQASFENSHAGEARAPWRVVGVVAVIAAGFVLAAWAGGLQS